MSSSIPFDGSIAGLSSLIAVFLILTTATLSLRFVARVKQNIKPGIDDWLAIIPCLCFMVFFGLGIYGMAKGFKGVNIPANPKDKAPASETEKVDWSSDLVSIVALGSIRLSAIFFYRRIFYTSRCDWFGRVTTGMIMLVISWTVGLFIETFLVCGGSISDIFQAAPTCAFKPWLYALAYSSMALDLVVIVLPIPKIWSLHATTIRKISISLVFLLAGAGLGASLARAIILTLLIRHDTAAIGTNDFYIINTKSCFYQFLEVGLGATAINLPSLWYFIKGAKPDRILRSVMSLVSIGSSSSLSKVASHKTQNRDASTSRKNDDQSLRKQSGVTGSSSDTVELTQTGIPRSQDQHELKIVVGMHRAP